MSEPHDGHDHDHVHGHSHGHGEPDDIAVRVKALESLLADRGLFDAAAVDAFIDLYETKIGPHIGARLVARAWKDPEFKARLLADATAVLKEENLNILQGEYLRFVENTPSVRNVIVCTLCSCYPWAILGISPAWYRAAPYRARVVKEPRAVVREMGLDVPKSVEMRVWDSTADLRYAVLPMRPPGTEHYSEEQLAALVTRDSIIGVGDPRNPMVKSA